MQQRKNNSIFQKNVFAEKAHPKLTSVFASPDASPRARPQILTLDEELDQPLASLRQS